MITSEFPFDLVLIYFLYGLTFFSLGLTTLLEAGRQSKLAEAQVLRPLGIFGILHGTHEWLETIMIIGTWMELDFSFQFGLIRVAVLAFSFLSLIAYGFQVVFPPKGFANWDAIIGLVMLVIYGVFLSVIGFSTHYEPSAWLLTSDVISRYMLAIPGAIFAGMALLLQARQAKGQARFQVQRSLAFVAIGFLAYSFTQIFVPPAGIFLANTINTSLFVDLFGVPIQLIRAIIAIFITAGVMRATQLSEKERQEELLQVQADRVQALEMVQDEMRQRMNLEQQLLRRSVVLQEEERTRIARELHDETAQVVTAFSANLAALRNKIGDSGKSAKALGNLDSLSNQISSNLRRLIYDLRPAHLDELGLIAALEFLVENVKQNLDLRVELIVDGESRRLESITETVLYRISQEALTNVARHAQVNEARVIVKFKAKKVTLSICDQGVGFNAENEQVLHSGLGLAGIRERIESVNGLLRIKSSSGEGSKITAVVPINKLNRSED